MSCPSVKECTCPKTECENHKKCCACVARHGANGNLPFCLRPVEENSKVKES